MDLPHRAILQKPDPNSGTDSLGARLTQWVSYGPLAVRFRPLNSSERFEAAQRQATTTHIAVCRYASEIAAADNSWRWKWGDRILTLAGKPVNVDEKNEWLQMTCEEGVRQE